MITPENDETKGTQIADVEFPSLLWGVQRIRTLLNNILLNYMYSE
jgi:hypothetical protein